MLPCFTRNVKSCRLFVRSFLRRKGASDSTPVVAGVVSAVAGAALIALGVFVKRRLASKQKTAQPGVPLGHDDDNIEQGRDHQPQGVHPPSSAVPALGDEGDKSPPGERNASPHRDAPAGAGVFDHGDVVLLAAPASPARAEQSSTVHRDTIVVDDQPPSHQHNVRPHRDVPEEAEGIDHGCIVTTSPATASSQQAEPSHSSAEHPDTNNNAVEGRWPSPQRKSSPHEHPPADAAGGVETRGIIPSSAPKPLDAQAQLSPELASSGAAAEGVCGAAGLAGEFEAGGSAEKTSLTATAPIATTSTTNLSTTERAELAGLHQRQRVADAASAAGGPFPDVESGDDLGASSAADRKHSAGDIGLSGAVMAAAEELAHHCQIPGVSEAASAVCIIANLVSDSRDNVRASESRLRQCRSIVMALKRADKVAAKVSSQEDPVACLAFGTGLL